jgi:TonB-linked outer membrane protein, SusC/RagA family
MKQNRRLMKDSPWLALLLCLLAVLPAYSQQHGEIRGTVTDNRGNMLEGVTVAATDSTGVQVSSTTTNAKGVFVLSRLRPGQKYGIRFSLVGYEPKEEQNFLVKAGDNNSILVRLTEQVSDLSEVLVTALGIKKEERSLGYAVQEIKGETFEKIKTDKVLDQLNGRVAGLTINSRSGILDDPVITLRGRTPLFVINGAPVDYYRAISQDDIASITVLKGPQASVLYGSRGKDGAIVITTKTEGEKHDVEIGVNSSTVVGVGYQTIPEEQHIYGQGEFGLYAYGDGKGGGIQDGMWIWGPKLDQPDPNTPSGWWETPQYNSPIDPNTGERVPIPWRSHRNNLRNILQPGLVTNNNLNVANRFDKGGYRASVNQMYRRGMLPNSELNRYGLTLSGNYQIADRWEVAANLIYSYTHTHNAPSVGYGNDHVYYNTLIYMGANNDVNDLKNYWMPGQEGYLQRNYNYSWFQNPWFLIHEYERPWGQREVIASANVSYEAAPRTKITLRGAHNYKYSPNEVHQPYAWVIGDRGRYEVNSNDKGTLDMDLMATHQYSKGKFDLDALAGANWFEFREQNFKGVTVGGLVIPDVYSFSNSQRQPTISGWLKEKRMFGLYGTATFSWDAALFLTLTGRNDWSSALDSDNRSFFYPSVSFSAVVSDLFTLPDPISFLKLRGSWVQVGRDTDPYNFSESYTYSTTWDGQPAFNPESTLIDPNIKPSFSTSYEAGIDVRFFRNRLRLDASYFNTLDENWIQTVNVPVTSGFSQMLTNGNNYRRTGTELLAEASIIDQIDFRWNVQANWFTYKTVLDYIYGGKSNYGNLKVGDRNDAMYVRVYQRDPQGNFIVNPSTGRMLVDPYARNLGNRDSDWEAGIANTFRYKRFTLNFQVAGRWGGLLESEVTARMIQSGKDVRTAVPERELDWGGTPRWIPSNAVIVTGGEISYDQTGNVIEDTRTFAPSDIPVFFKDWMSDLGALNTNYTMGWNVYSGSFVKLRNATLTYDFSKIVNQSAFLKGLEASLIGENLLIWKKLANEDPDADQKTLSYPTERYVGLNFTFKF